jgi:hypothetical protein
LTVDAASIEYLLGDIDTEKVSEPFFFIYLSSSNPYMVKAGSTSPPILHRNKDSMTQSTYYGLGGKGQTEISVL